jgi:hypothetical protein
MCRLDAAISYSIYVGNNATEVMSGFFNNLNSFNTNYNAYAGYISSVLSTGYFNSTEDDLTRTGGPQYIYCDACMVEQSGNDYTMDSLEALHIRAII